MAEGFYGHLGSATGPQKEAVESRHPVYRCFTSQGAASLEESIEIQPGAVTEVALQLGLRRLDTESHYNLGRVPGAPSIRYIFEAGAQEGVMQFTCVRNDTWAYPQE